MSVANAIDEVKQAVRLDRLAVARAILHIIDDNVMIGQALESDTFPYARQDEIYAHIRRIRGELHAARLRETESRTAAPSEPRREE